MRTRRFMERRRRKPQRQRRPAPIAFEMPDDEDREAVIGCGEDKGDKA